MLDLPEDISNKKFLKTDKVDSLDEKFITIPENYYKDIVPEDKINDMPVDSTLAINQSDKINPIEELTKPTSSLPIESSDFPKNEPMILSSKPKSQNQPSKSGSKKNVAEQLKHFQEVQYPFLYSKIYDFYNYSLVDNKPLDIILKILIIFTILILLGIVLIIAIEIFRLLI